MLIYNVEIFKRLPCQCNCSNSSSCRAYDEREVIKLSGLVEWNGSNKCLKRIHEKRMTLKAKKDDPPAVLLQQQLLLL